MKSIFFITFICLAITVTAVTFSSQKLASRFLTQKENALWAADNDDHKGVSESQTQAPEKELGLEVSKDGEVTIGSHKMKLDELSELVEYGQLAIKLCGPGLKNCLKKDGSDARFKSLEEGPEGKDESAKTAGLSESENKDPNESQAGQAAEENSSQASGKEISIGNFVIKVEELSELVKFGQKAKELCGPKLVNCVNNQENSSRFDTAEPKDESKNSDSRGLAESQNEKPKSDSEAKTSSESVNKEISIGTLKIKEEEAVELIEFGRLALKKCGAELENCLNDEEKKNENRYNKGKPEENVEEQSSKSSSEGSKSKSAAENIEPKADASAEENSTEKSEEISIGALKIKVDELAKLIEFGLSAMKKCGAELQHCVNEKNDLRLDEVKPSEKKKSKKEKKEGKEDDKKEGETEEEEEEEEKSESEKNLASKEKGAEKKAAKTEKKAEKEEKKAAAKADKSSESQSEVKKGEKAEGKKSEKAEEKKGEAEGKKSEKEEEKKRENAEEKKSEKAKEKKSEKDEEEGESDSAEVAVPQAHEETESKESQESKEENSEPVESSKKGNSEKKDDGKAAKNAEVKAAAKSDEKSAVKGEENEAKTSEEKSEKKGDEKKPGSVKNESKEKDEGTSEENEEEETEDEKATDKKKDKKEKKKDKKKGDENAENSNESSEEGRFKQSEDDLQHYAIGNDSPTDNFVIVDQKEESAEKASMEAADRVIKDERNLNTYGSDLNGPSS